MIRKVIDIKELSGVTSPLLPLIYGDFYYHYNSADGVYIQLLEGSLTAAISLKNTCCTIIKTGKKLDFSEIESFLFFCGVTSVTSDFPFGSKNEKAYNLLKIKNNSYNQDKDIFALSNKSTFSEYKVIYDLISSNEGFNFSEWYSFFSRKVNLGNASGVCLKANDEFISSAIAPVIYNNSAIIAGVITKDKYRNLGYGTKCIKALLNEINNLNIDVTYLWCDESKLEFYKSIGFTTCGEVYVREEF